VRDQRVVDEPRAVHRLDHPAHRLAIDGDTAREPVQAVAVRRHREMIDQLPPIGDQADIDPLATQIQANVQHQLLLSQHDAGRIRPARRVP